MTTGTTVIPPAAASDTTPEVAAAAPTAETPGAVGETLTISGLCDLLRGLADPNTRIKGTSRVSMLTLSFSAPHGKTIQHDTWTHEIETTALAKCLRDHSAVAFSGGKMRARALLAALEPCVETHGHARVCMKGARAVAGRGPYTELSIATDGLLFAADPRATAGIAKQKEAVFLAETLAASRRLDPQVIAETASVFMPVQWVETRYWLDGTLAASLKDRLPRITTKEIDVLFRPTGPTAEETATTDHGRFTIMTPIAGLTYEALVEAYGPKTQRPSKADRLVAVAAANAASATVTEAAAESLSA